MTILRGPLRDAAQSTEEGEKGRHQVRIGAQKVRERVLSQSGNRPGGFSSAVLRHLDELTGALDELPFESPEQKEPWLRRTNRLIDQTVSDIEQWSRWG